MSKGKSKPANSEQPTTKQLEKISSEDSGESKHSNKEQKPQALPVSYIKGRRPNATGPIGSRKPR